MSKEEWLARLATAATFGGFVDGALSGMVVFSRPTRPKLAHTGDDRRDVCARRGARHGPRRCADRGRFSTTPRASSSRSSSRSNAENARAIKFYERHGFRPIGRIPRSLQVGGRYYDELLMLRPVSSSD